MKIKYFDSPIDDRQRSKLLMVGDLLIYQQIPAMLDLIEFTTQLLNCHLDGLDPTSAQQHLNRDQFLYKVGAAQAEFRKSDQAKALFFEVLSACGVNRKDCYYDHFPLRVVPFAQQHNGGQQSSVGHHRDTWGSNIACQQNWWAPIFDLTVQRTIAIYPYYWDKPIANTTANWSFKAFLAARASTQQERLVNYPSAPKPTVVIDETQVIKLVIRPGDVLNFSSAHLHASVQNTSKATRFSVEMRTVNGLDLNRKVNAPNVDNAGVEKMYQWFKHIDTKQKLRPALIN